MGRVLHASKSGWFPFCIDQIDSTYPPIYSTASLDSVMKIFWRIKKIRFYGTYTQQNDGNPISVPWEFIAERNAAEEENLVCNPIPAWNTISLENLQSASFSFSGNVVAYKNIENDEFVLQAFIQGVLIDVLLEEVISFSSIPTDPGSQTLNFEGILFTNSPPEFSLPGTINYEILEYWSYGGTYDTATGLPL